MFHTSPFYINGRRIDPNRWTPQERLNYHLVNVSGSPETSISDIEELLKQGADINTRNYSDYSALGIAAEKGHTKTVQYLLDRGAKIETKDNAGNTPLILAAHNDYPEISETIQTLITYGAIIEAKNNNGETALIAATKHGRTAAINCLLDNGANSEARNNTGRTALMIASYNNDANTVQSLLDKGANIEARDNTGQTALMIASYRNDTNTLEYFPHETDAKYIIAALDRHNDRNALMYKTTQCLIDNGADIEAVDHHGYTALTHSLANHQRLLSARTLITNGAKANNKAEIDRMEYSSFQRYLILLACNTPEGKLQNTIMQKLSAEEQIQTLALIQLKEDLTKTELTKYQQCRTLAFKSGVENTRNYATYLAAILPEGDLRNGIIKQYEQENHFEKLNKEKISALRCFAYGVREIVDGKEKVIREGITKTVIGEDGKDKTVIDYQRAGEVIKKLATNEELLGELTLVTQNMIDSQQEFIKTAGNTATNLDAKNLTFANSYLTAKINSHLSDEKVVGSSLVLNIFQAYMENHAKSPNTNFSSRTVAKVSSTECCTIS